MTTQQQQSELGRVIQRSWSDPLFKERLKNNPKAVLAEMGVETPAGLDIEVVENTPAKLYLTLPAPPRRESPDDEQIALAAVSPRSGTCTKTTYKCC
jgi:hypothetical protein